MRNKLINAIKNALELKREIHDGLSTNDIRLIIAAFLNDVDEDIAWSVSQYFLRKYKSL